MDFARLGLGVAVNRPDPMVCRACLGHHPPPWVRPMTPAERAIRALGVDLPPEEMASAIRDVADNIAAAPYPTVPMPVTAHWRVTWDSAQ
jgi:hypothetical protein